MRITAEVPPPAELLDLYAAVGWSAYTNDPDTLVAAVAGSALVLSARAEDGALLGLARVIGDGAVICYLQDVLVRPEAQRRGIGRALVQGVFERFGHVRQIVLLTDDEPAQREFYESLGFVETRDAAGGTLRCFVRFAA